MTVVVTMVVVVTVMMVMVMVMVVMMVVVADFARLVMMVACRAVLVVVMMVRVRFLLARLDPEGRAADEDHSRERQAAKQDGSIELLGQDVVLHQQIDAPNEKADAGEQAANGDGGDLVEKVI